MWWKLVIPSAGCAVTFAQLTVIAGELEHEAAGAQVQNMTMLVTQCTLLVLAVA